MTAINDTLLVSRAALLGDDRAFCQLVEAYQSPIRRFLFNLAEGDEELSKDLAQETFIKAWLNIASFRAAAKFSTWLYRIAYNVFYDHARTAKQTFSIDEVQQFATPAPDADRRMDFAHALGLLKNDERSAMLLFYMEDMSVEKISKVMNCPTGTVKSHLFRGKEKLSVYFKNSGYDK
ncbi:RNA polymerase sigma factor [Bacteroidia bacterium]|nr:RNA polymerase sigma factor [Bacteroidia bacterium]